MTLDNEKQTVLEVLDGIARRDRSLLERLVTDDVVWWVPRSAARHGLARPLVGRPAVVELLRGSKDFFRADTTTWTVISMIGEGSSVVAHVERRCLTSKGAETYRLSLDGRLVIARHGIGAQQRMQKLRFDTPDDARGAYFARLNDLARRGYLDATQD